MSRRSALATALVILPAARAAIDAVEAVLELAERFGLSDLGTGHRIGDWELDAEFSATRFGLGVLFDHQPPASPTHGDLTTAGLLVGPLRLSATRARLASDLLDCTLAGPLPWPPSDVAIPLPPCAEPGCTNLRRHRHEPIAVARPSKWSALERGEHLTSQPDPRRAL